MRFLVLCLILFNFLLVSLSYSESLLKKAEKELSQWRKEINKKPYLLNLKKLENPFFGSVYKKYFRKEKEFQPFKLVGIVKKKGGNLALLQDHFSKGYIVREGSRVGNFFVIKVADNYILVEKEEYDIFGKKIKK